MSVAQAQTYSELQSSGARVASNDEVLAILRRMPNQQGTYKEVIAFVAGDRQMTAAEGNALSAPIIRALSELASEGLVDASTLTINEETGRPNTLYRALVRPGMAKPPAKQTWKDRALALERELKELRVKYEVACRTIDRLESKP